MQNSTEIPSQNGNKNVHAKVNVNSPCKTESAMIIQKWIWNFYRGLNLKFLENTQSEMFTHNLELNNMRNPNSCE